MPYCISRRDFHKTLTIRNNINEAQITTKNYPITGLLLTQAGISYTKYVHSYCDSLLGFQTLWCFC